VAAPVIGAIYQKAVDAGRAHFAEGDLLLAPDLRHDRMIPRSAAESNHQRFVAQGAGELQRVVGVEKLPGAFDDHSGRVTGSGWRHIAGA
jgi:hypothetical protein